MVFMRSGMKSFNLPSQNFQELRIQRSLKLVCGLALVPQAFVNKADFALSIAIFKPFADTIYKYQV